MSPSGISGTGAVKTTPKSGFYGSDQTPVFYKWAVRVELNMKESGIIIYTIGHSSRSLDEFVELLKINNICRVVDIRTIPGSRHNPQFNREVFSKSIRNRHFYYSYMKALGGLRRPLKDSINTQWKNSSFRGFADYMQTAEFAEALDRLMKISSGKRTAIMCAEAVPWRCHRSLIADALTIHRIEVEHIISKKSIKKHVMTPFGKIEHGRIYYPEAR